MSSQPFIYKSDIYLQFKELDKTSLRSVVHYYEKNKELLFQLDVKEYFEVLATYAQALFDLGQYGKYIGVADELIFLVIDQNIYEFEKEDIYCSTLFRKAASHYNLQEKDTAERILKEMIRMYPDNKYVISFYKKILSREKSISRKTRGIAVGAFLLSALVIAIELLIIRPFYEDWITLTEWSRYIIFGLGLITYVVGELYGLLTVEWRVRKELNSIKKKQKMKL